jgi:hypothetical protein
LPPLTRWNPMTVGWLRHGHRAARRTTAKREGAAAAPGMRIVAPKGQSGGPPALVASIAKRRWEHVGSRTLLPTARNGAQWL